MAVETVIVDAGNRAWRLHIVQLAVLAVVAVMGLLASDLVFGLNPNNPDSGLSILERVLLGLGLAVLAAALVAGVTLMGLRYVVAMRHADGMVEITTQAPCWRYRFRVPLGSLSLGTVHAPVVSGRQYVDAPWQTLRIEGWRIPFVIDLQAARYDATALRRLLREATPVPER